MSIFLLIERPEATSRVLCLRGLENTISIDPLGVIGVGHGRYAAAWFSIINLGESIAICPKIAGLRLRGSPCPTESILGHGDKIEFEDYKISLFLTSLSSEVRGRAEMAYPTATKLNYSVRYAIWQAKHEVHLEPGMLFTVGSHPSDGIYLGFPEVQAGHVSLEVLSSSIRVTSSRGSYRTSRRANIVTAGESISLLPIGISFHLHENNRESPLP